jgi:hypothetical protein
MDLLGGISGQKDNSESFGYLDAPLLYHKDLPQSLAARLATKHQRYRLKHCQTLVRHLD